MVSALNTDFYRGFRLNLRGISIALVYMNAFKSIDGYGPDDAKQVRASLKELFETNAVVLGDLNSSPFAIQKELRILGLDRELFNTPTYLFPAPDLKGSAQLPCFDNVVWDKRRLERVNFRPLFTLPKTVKENPRHLISKLDLLSDHIPIHVSLFGPVELKILGYNVADPLLWSQYYPAAGQGFELHYEAEGRRQKRLLAAIEESIGKYEYIFLQEVPYTLAEQIKRRFKGVSAIDMQSAVELEEPSQLVLIQNRMSVRQ